MTGSLRATTFGFALVLFSLCAWEARPYAAEIRQIRSPGGISAWLVEEKSLPTIAIRFAFEGGSAQEAVGKEGTAGLLAAMLDQGAGELSAGDYQKELERLSVRLAFDSDRDRSEERRVGKE